MMEYWNVDYKRSFFNISNLGVKKKSVNYPISHFSKTPGPDRLLIVFVLQWLNLKMRTTIF